MGNKISLILAAVVLLLLGALLFLSFHYYGKYAAEAKANQTLTQQNQAADLAIRSQTQFITLFNTLAGTTLNEQAKNTAASQDRAAVIQTVIKTEPCAVAVVPAAAADVLLRHYRQLRQSAGDADTGQPDGALPAVAAAR